MDSEAQPQPLRVLFFPFMAAGHTIPMVDMAKLFSSNDVAATILTTPANAALLLPNLLHHPSITLHIIPFPTAAAGLPDGCEDFASVPSQDMQTNFLAAVALLRRPFEHTLSSLRPDAVVTDMFLPWTADIASSHSIPRIEFHGTGFFPLCARAMLDRHNTLQNLPPEALTLTIPNLPHKIEMLRSQMQDSTKTSPGFQQLFKAVKESEPKTYGVLVNSFYELEPAYAEHFRSTVGRRAWHVGPVALCSKDESDRINLGNIVRTEDCLFWLDSKPPGSVLYVCFGSMSDFTDGQLAELALGLEASGHPFVWVVRKGLVPGGFEERVKGRGLIIRGWAPQMLILEHSAVGAFVTHCGWNSVLEAVSAGVTMVTWPLYAEQFFNERLVVEVLGIGVAIGAKVFALWAEERPLIEAAAVEQAVRKVMGGYEEVDERKKKAKQFGEAAKKAVEEGGSSFRDAEELIKELIDMRERQEQM